MRLTVIKLKDTGHVLAALVEPDTGPPGLDTLVGDGLSLAPVRTRAVGPDVMGRFFVPAALLETRSIAFNTAVLAAPQDYAVNGGSIARLAALAGSTATIDTLSVTVNPGAPVDSKLVVLVRGVADSSVSRTQTGKITAAGNTALTLKIDPDSGPGASIPAGTDCFIAVACEGQQLYFRRDAA